MKIIITEDNMLYASMIENHLKQNTTFEIEKFCTGEECVTALDGNPDLILLDYNLNIDDDDAKTGHDFLKEIKKIRPEQAVVMLSSLDNVPQVVDLLRIGAYDYILKDENTFINLDKITGNINNLLLMKNEMRNLKLQVLRQRKRMLATVVVISVLMVSVLCFV